MVPVLGPEIVHDGGLVGGPLIGTQVSVLAPAIPPSTKSLQLLSVRVKLACANAPADVKAKIAAALASAAQRVNDRFMSDSLSGTPTVVPRNPCKFRASFSIETRNSTELYNDFPHCAKSYRIPSVRDLATLGT
jgi:hypothetical protein